MKRVKLMAKIDGKYYDVSNKVDILVAVQDEDSFNPEAWEVTDSCTAKLSDMYDRIAVQVMMSMSIAGEANTGKNIYVDAKKV